MKLKLSRKQWILVVVAILVILLLWFMSKQKGGGAGSTADTMEETSAGDATLRKSESPISVTFDPLLRVRNGLI